MPPSDLEHSLFEPHVGSAFGMEVGEGEVVELELVAARALGPGSGPRRQPFALHLRSREASVRPQRIYTLSHPVLGRLELFLVPVGREGAGVLYEAIFN
jgi:hypothetical protein